MPHINWKSVGYIINYYLTQWTDNRMPYKRGTDNRGSTVLAWKYISSYVYFNELSLSAVRQSTYIIMPSFAKLIAITFPLKK